MADKQFDNTNRGAAFRQDDKQNPKWSDYKGKLNVEGKEFWLDIWVKEGRKGKFLSVSIKPIRARETPF